MQGAHVGVAGAALLDRLVLTLSCKLAFCRLVIRLREGRHRHNLAHDELLAQSHDALDRPVQTDRAGYPKRKHSGHQGHGDIHHGSGAAHSGVIGSGGLVGQFARQLGGSEVDAEGQHGNEQQQARVRDVRSQTDVEIRDAVRVEHLADLAEAVRTVGEEAKILHRLQGGDAHLPDLGQDLDGAAVGLERHSQTAGGAGRGRKGGKGVRQIRGATHHILQRVNDHVVQGEHDRQGSQQRQAAGAHGVVALLLVHLLDLALHLLHGRLVGAPGVLLADRHLLGTEPRLLAGVVLLNDGNRQHDDLHRDGKEHGSEEEVSEAQHLDHPLKSDRNPHQDAG